jgi:hypothetical protein
MALKVALNEPSESFGSILGVGFDRSGVSHSPATFIGDDDAIDVQQGEMIFPPFSYLLIHPGGSVPHCFAPGFGYHFPIGGVGQ